MTTTAGALPAAPTIPFTSAGRGVMLGLSVTGAALLVLGAALGPLMMFDARPYSELAGTPAHLLHYATWTACLVALSQLYPRLAGAGGAGRISPAAATVAGVGAALDACARFTLAFVNPMLADHAPELLDTAPDAVLLVPSLAAGVVAMVGTVWLAVSGRRAGAFPVPAVVLLVLGAIAIPAVGPLSNILVGAGLMWVGVTSLRRR